MSAKTAMQRSIAIQRSNMLLKPSRCLYARSRTQYRSYTSANSPPLSPSETLSRFLSDAIKTSGPLSVARFMRQALTNPIAGYYMTRDVFGTKGDFITSPEISQVFGELCGVWFLTRWISAGKPKIVSLVEFGPGRGTLMSDMLRAIHRFPELGKCLECVYMIEASPALTKLQHSKLCKEALTDRKSVTTYGTRIEWYNDLREVSDLGFSFVMMHEFLDALPVYKFEKTQHGWREILVDVAEQTKGFRLSIAPARTPALLAHLPTLEKRFNHMPIGSRVEICPEAYDVVRQLSSRLSKNGGAALLIDYGDEIVRGDSLRGIRNHVVVDPLSEPGSTDLSADVDFGFMREAATVEGASHKVNVFGPSRQAKFLLSLGMQERINRLVRGMMAKGGENKETTKTVENIVSGAKRLVDESTATSAMGRIYKCMALTTQEDVPVGF